MVCVFEYNGKRFSQDELAKELEKMPPHIAHNYIEGVPNLPNAPFKTTWSDLALKRMIRKAASEGYDAISWTPGEAQAARYDLSKHIERLEYNKQDNLLRGYKENNNRVIDQIAKPEELPNIVGKEVADRLLNNPTRKSSSGIANVDNIKPDEQAITKYKNEWDTIVNQKRKLEENDPQGYHNHPEYFKLSDKLDRLHDKMIGETTLRLGNNEHIHHLSGLDLKVGGEGMKTFYDKMLVDKANAIAKKFGGRVEQVEIPETLKKTLTGFQKGSNPAYNVHVLRLPPALKDTALRKGFPLFAGGLPLTPIDRNPFEDKYKLTPIEGNPFE